MTEPLKYFNTIYPFDKTLIDQLVIGEKYVGIMLKNGQIGVCSTLQNQIAFDIDTITEIDLCDINHRIIYNAYINALLNYHDNYRSDKDIFEAIDFSKESQIVMIGFFRPLVEKFQTANIPLTIFDLHNKDNIIQPASQKKAVLKEAGTVILTSTSIFNDTFLDIVKNTPQDCRIYLLGPSSVMHRYMLTFRNIENIFGAVFPKNDHRILQTIRNGEGTRSFLPLGTKVYI